MVTIKDIAKIAGVSHSTVSRSLNDSSEISLATKEKVKAIAQELGFEFNNNARSLSTKKTGTIGLIFDKGFDNENASFFFSKLLKEIRYSLEKASLDIILDFRDNPFTGKNNIRKLINGKKIDGFIIADEYVAEEELKYIYEKKIPTILVHNLPTNYQKYDFGSVMTDHFNGGYIATEHLLKSGHKSIITFTHKIYKKEYSEFEERTEGFKKALNDYGVSFEKTMIYRDEISFDYGRRKIKELIRNNIKFTGVFAQTDLLALGIIRGIKEMKMRVPEDIAVIGYDNIEFGKFSEPELTTVNQPTEKLAEEAVNILVKSLNQEKATIEKNIIIKPNLIIRNSSK